MAAVRASYVHASQSLPGVRRFDVSGGGADAPVSGPAPAPTSRVVLPSYGAHSRRTGVRRPPVRDGGITAPLIPEAAVRANLGPSAGCANSIADPRPRSPTGNAWSPTQRLVTEGTIKKGGEVGMTALIVLAFLVLIGPLSYLYGVDSRRLGDRGWVGGRRS